MPVNPTLSDAARSFLSGPRFASVATVDADGQPRQTVVWFRLLPDDRILLNGRSPRRWCANLDRTRKVAISVIDEEDGYRWVGLTGVVDSISEDVEVARQDIVDLAHRYHDDNPDPALVAAFRTQPRITYILRITGIHDHLED